MKTVFNGKVSVMRTLWIGPTVCWLEIRKV